jgi:glutaredoxin
LAATRIKDWASLGAVALLAYLASQWWVASSQRSLGEELAALAKPGDIVMLSSDTCAPCLAARQWLQSHDVRFAECFIERDADCRSQHQASLMPGTPVLRVRGQWQSGFSPERVLRQLRSAAANAASVHHSVHQPARS